VSFRLPHRPENQRPPKRDWVALITAILNFLTTTMKAGLFETLADFFR
jgi:hypothetical protein